LKDNQRKSARGGKREGAGRPKGSLNRATADVKAAAQKYTDEALKTLAAIMRDADSAPARVAACKEILDRGHGKSHQSSDLTIRDERMVVEAPVPAKDADDWASKYGPH
jgi:hypothetical protein